MGGNLEGPPVPFDGSQYVWPGGDLTMSMEQIDGASIRFTFLETTAAEEAEETRVLCTAEADTIACETER